LEVGFTITTTQPETSALLEPHASPVATRLSALKELKNLGIGTYVFLGPVIPYVTDEESVLKKSIHDIAEVEPKYVIVDRLNLRSGVLSKVKLFLSKYSPSLIPVYDKLLPTLDSYFEDVKSAVAKLCVAEGLDYEFCY